MGTRFFQKRADRLDRFLANYRWLEAPAALLAGLLLIYDLGIRRGHVVHPQEVLALEVVFVTIFLIRLIFTYLLAPPFEPPPQKFSGGREFTKDRDFSRSRPAQQAQRSKSGLYFPVSNTPPPKPDLLDKFFGWFERLAISRRFLGGLMRARKESILLAIAALGFALTPLAPDTSEALSDGLKLTLVGFVLLWIFGVIDRAQKLSVSPLGIFIMTYMLIIVGGAALLVLPRATVADTPMTFVDALFMSASASCVTGLTIYDIGLQFTTFGQLVLLVLIQVGGLGIMTFAAFATIAMGSGLSFKDRIAMGEVLNYDTVGRVGRLVAWILAITIISEAVGAVILMGNWVDRSTGIPLEFADQLYFSVYHSISAFCNAGFSLYPDSLVRYQGDLSVMIPMSLLIVIGGLGFAVIIDILRLNPLHSRWARKFAFIRKRVDTKPVPRLTLQTKLVFVVTLCLIVVGTGMFWLLEVDNPATLMHSGVKDQIIGSLFHGGITPRTAGFNSLDYSKMSPSTQHLTMLLMFIGASPGSTGGGLKTTAVAILVLSLWNTLRGRPIEAFKRRIRDEQVRRVLVMLVIGLVVVNGAIFLLSITESVIMHKPLGYQQLSFEVVSAFATTGLSTGITNDFSATGKFVLSVCMFLGRVGPVTLVLSLGAKPTARFDYPHETVMLG